MDSLTLEQVKDLMDAMERNKIQRFSFKNKNFEIALEGQEGHSSLSPGSYGNSDLSGTNESFASVVSETVNTGEKEPAVLGQVVTSPIVGTFYSAPSPDKPPYVSVGKEVASGDTLFIIESMKLMNEVTSEHTGTVAEILVEDGQPVEFGQPILRIK